MVLKSTGGFAQGEWSPCNPFSGGGDISKKGFSGGKNKGSSSNRRKRYNFIADVVQEVGSALVYIEIKDRGRVDAFTGMPQGSS